MSIDERDGRAFPKRWTGLTAAGTNQATAFVLLDGGYHEFTTVASGSGAVLPIIMPWSREITISNNGTSALLIYPPSGGTIDTVSSSVSLAAGSSATYWATSPTNWQDRVTGGSGGGGGGSSTITEVSQASSFTASAGAFYAISGSAAVTATLPTAVGIAGQTIRVRCVSGFTGLCTIVGTSGQTIGGQANRIIYAGESPLLQSDGTNWARTGGTVIPTACQISLGTTQTLTNNSAAVTQFNTVNFDNTGQMTIVASNQIKILRPGQYRVGAAVYFGNITTATTDVYQSNIQVFKNGSGITIAAQANEAGPGIPFSFVPVLSGMATFAAGDLVTLVSYVNHSGAQAVPLDSGNATYFEVEEIPSW